ncbi:nucleoside-diphosphate-sugar epimerase [Nocardia sp. GAS34]|uniref:NAD-dependent epimerase/dehydratase family protein n=1 Tax=unclassified Nocardia TaxID=2637762 RepID=UPI003D1C5B5C
MAKKIMLTGGAGYIGSVLTRTLLANGFRVVVADRFFFGRDKLPQDSADLTVISKDVRALTRSDLDGVDCVIDLAAISNDPAGELDPQLTLDINLHARVRCAQLARETGVARYILPSSSSVYGQQEGLLSESAAVEPRTTYAAANAQAEAAVLDFAGDGFTVVVVRQATVFGMSQRMRLDLVVHKMVIQAVRRGLIPVLGDGQQCRPFVHIADVADAFVRLIGAPAEIVTGQRFNLGGNTMNFRTRELAEIVGAETNVDRFDHYPGLDDRSHRMDFSKIESILNFVPARTIQDGVRDVVAGLASGSVEETDPRCYTVPWYEQLLNSGGPGSPATF